MIYTMLIKLMAILIGGGMINRHVGVLAANDSISYVPGLLKIFVNNSKEVSICMTYPIQRFTISPTSEDFYKLSYTQKIDLCQKNLTVKDFIPKENNSMILLWASTNCSISGYFDLIKEGHSSGVILLSNTSYYVNKTFVQDMDLFGIIQDENIAKFDAAAKPGDDIRFQMFGLATDKFDFSLLMLWLGAVICVGIGSLTSPYRSILTPSKPIATEDSESLRENRKESDASTKVQDSFTVPIALGLVLFITATLLLLYFFYQYLVYFFIGVFCLASSHAMYALACQLFFVLAPGLQNFRIRWFVIHELVLAIICMTIGIIWIVYRRSAWVWWLQDILGICFCIHLIQGMLAPNLKIITIILVLLFIYDIFFVYITPYFTKNGKSVMIEVATGMSGSGSSEQLPMLLQFPHLRSFPVDICAKFQNSLLGFGDIIVPGLLVSFAHNFDIARHISKRPYFISTFIAYGFGLGCAFIGLVIMQSGQPALFYIVPCILVCIFALGLIRKELGMLWRGEVTVTPPSEPEPEPEPV